MVKNSKGNRDQDHVLVYSTDPIPPKKETTPVKESPYALSPAVRMEKKGRGGKSVTVLFKLPAHESLLRALSGFLKKSMGSGGTSYVKNGEGFVEVQGEHQKHILEVVKKFKWP